MNEKHPVPFTVSVWRTSVTGEPNLEHAGGGLSQDWRLDPGVLSQYTVANSIRRWCFLILFLVIHLVARQCCTWGWCQKDAGKKLYWKCKSLDWISCKNAKKPCCCCCCLLLKSCINLSHQRLLLMVTVSTWWLLSMFFFHKFCCFWQVLFNLAACYCCTSYISCKQCKCFNGSLVISTCIFASVKKSSPPLVGWIIVGKLCGCLPSEVVRMSVGLLRWRRALHHWLAESLLANCVAACQVRWSGCRLDYTGRSRWHLCWRLLPRAIHKGMLGFSEQGALPLGRCGGKFCFLGALTIGMTSFTDGM